MNQPTETGEISESAAARSKNVAILEGSAPIDPDLAAVIDAWPELPEAVRADIVAMVRSADSAL
ncbi:hypothetical protein OAS39_00025 [Pirellulales bacterium]|nr:hypothetical protein [Pirellulales bacterium]